MSVLWIGLIAVVGQPPLDEGTVDPPPVLELEPDAVEEPSPPAPSPPTPARPVPSPDEPLPPANSVDEDTDPDLPLRIVGALCGGVVGFYCGQYVTPLIVIPVVLVGIIGAVFFAPAVLAFLASLPPALLTATPLIVAYVAFPLVALIGPVIGAIIGGTLGYEHAPGLVGNFGQRFQDGPPKGDDAAMAY